MCSRIVSYLQIVFSRTIRGVFPIQAMWLLSADRGGSEANTQLVCQNSATRFRKNLNDFTPRDGVLPNK
jgi:hypothetical protein